MRTLPLLFIMIVSDLFPQGAKLEWARSYGNQGNAIAVDVAGNVYTSGFYYFSGVDLDPGPDLDWRTNKGRNDIFIHKLDSNGNYIWGRTIGGSNDEQVTSMTLDDSGNVYACGGFQGKVDFDPGPGIYNLTSNTFSDGFILKLNGNGIFQWAKAINGYGFDNCADMAKGPGDELYITGSFSGLADMDPGPDTFWLKGRDNAYALKLDRNGNFVWAKSWGGTTGESISVDPDGKLYISGYFAMKADFDPGPDSFFLNAPYSPVPISDGFLTKLDSSGNFLWARQLHGKGHEFNSELAIRDDAVYMGGLFTDSIDLDIGPDTLIFFPHGGYECYLLKSDTAGNFQWAKSWGGPEDDYVYGLATDAQANVYICGLFNDTAWLDSDDSLRTPSVENGDIYLKKLDPDGKSVWMKTISGPEYQKADDLFISPSGQLYATGRYGTYVTDFDPGPDSFFIDPGNKYESFAIKITPCRSYSFDHIRQACDSFKWVDGKTYTQSNFNATYTYLTANNCDSVARLKLSILKNGSTHIVNSCNSYKWTDGKTYTSSNNMARDTFKNINGCDSIVRLNLTILSSSIRVDSIVACDSFKWIDDITYKDDNYVANFMMPNYKGCDSIVGLKLKILRSSWRTDSVMVCDSFRWLNGITYKQSNNTAKYILKNRAGCDSMIMLNLTIIRQSEFMDTIAACYHYKWMDGKTYGSNNNTAVYHLSNYLGCDSIIRLNLTINSVDTVVLKDSAKLTARVTGALYQWLDCDKSHGAISGQTSRIFNPSVNGNYAVRVIKNGCMDTSRCYAVTELSIIDNPFGSGFRLYPNPGNGFFTVELDRVYENVSARVLTVEGKEISYREWTSTSRLQLETGKVAGYYVVEIRAGGKVGRIGVVKQ